MNNKQKGSQFEREMSRLLSLWWTRGKRDDAIWRSASSGGLATVGKGRYLEQSGDFQATDQEATSLFDKYIIEAKKGYNKFSIQDIIDVPGNRLKKNPVWQILTRLEKDCGEQGKMGILLWKRDRRELLVAVQGGILPNIYPCLAVFTDSLSGPWIFTTWPVFISVVVSSSSCPSESDATASLSEDQVLVTPAPL